jgi:hypothetical protein
MGKGICELVPGSRAAAEVGVRLEESGPKKELLPAPGGTVEVGDGRTSLSLNGGSLRSVFQMPVPQPKLDPGVRPIVEEVE